VIWIIICSIIHAVKRKDANRKMNYLATLLIGISPISLAMSLYEAYQFYSLNLMQQAYITAGAGLVFNLFISNVFLIVLCAVFSKN
jgi:hypothetical protein